MADEVRIDKWLWAVRIFKTRGLAAEAIKRKRVFINDQLVKPSRGVKIGDKVSVIKAPVTYSYLVLDITGKRMGAKLVPDFMKDITPPDQLEILELHKINTRLMRPKGIGRPTKKDRRDLEEFTAWQDDDDDDF